MNIWDYIKAGAAAVGALVGAFLGGVDGLIFTLLAIVAIDYLTGVICAVEEKTLSSEVGFKGIAKKVCIFLMVGMANLLDTYVFGGTAILRTAVIFFYLSNEGISVLENSVRLGLKVPDGLKEALLQIQTEQKKP